MFIGNNIICIKVTTPNSKYTLSNYIESYPHMNKYLSSYFEVLYCNMITVENYTFFPTKCNFIRHKICSCRNITD